MNHVFADQEIIRECEAAFEQHMSALKIEIAAKLGDFNTNHGADLIADFEQTLNDHASDILNDTLTAWGAELKAAEEFGEPMPMLTGSVAFPQQAAE